VEEDASYVCLEHIESGTGKLLSWAESREVESAMTLFRSGDVLFGKLRPYLAKVILAESSGACSTELLVFRSLESIDSTYLSYQMLSAEFIRWIDSMTYGTKMPRVDPSDIESVEICLPPLAEQREIAAYLDRETGKIDALIGKVEGAIALLREYRAALISAAVTGKIDVREREAA